MSATSNPALASPSSALTLGLLGPSVPEDARGEFADPLVELDYLFAVDNAESGDATEAQSLRLFNLLRDHRPVDVAHCDYLLWLLRVVAASYLAGQPACGCEFLTQETLVVQAPAESWLAYVRESAIVSSLELLGKLSRRWEPEGDAAASKLVANQRQFEGPWLDTVPVEDRKPVAYALLGHYHLTSAMAKAAQYLAGRLSESAIEVGDYLQKAFGHARVGFGHADDIELMLVLPLIQGACRRYLASSSTDQ